MGHRCDEAITLAGQGFKEASCSPEFSEDLAQVIDRFVEAAIDVDKSARWPQPADKFFAGHWFAGLFQRGQQKLQGLFTKSSIASVMGQFSGTGIERKDTKTIGSARSGVRALRAQDA